VSFSHVSLHWVPKKKKVYSIGIPFSHSAPPRAHNFEAKYFGVLDLRKRVLYEHVWSSGCYEIADEDPNSEEYVVRAFSN